MKKQLIFLLSFVMLSFGAMAESKLQVKAFDGNVTFGVKAAMNLPHFWDGLLAHGFRNGGQVGLFAEYKSNNPKFNRWSIAPELMFSSQGGKFTVNEELEQVLGDLFQLKGMLAAGLNKDIIFTTNYINIPIMVKYRLNQFFSVEAGPQIGFNVYSKVRIDGVDANLDLDKVTNTVDFGLGAGATYYLNDNVMFHVRYNMDFLHTFKDIDDKNGNIQFGIGYRF